MTEAILDNKIEAAEEIQPEKLYTFRPLRAEDTFLMCKLIKAIGIKEFKALFADGGFKALFAETQQKQKAEAEQAEGEQAEAEQETASDAVVQVGIAVFLDIADVIIGNLPNCEKEIFQLLAAVSDMKEAEIRKMGFADFFQMVIDFVQKEEFKDFIQVVSKLF